MLDMIRQSAVPATLMRTAAKGALALPESEMLEILVYLAAHPVFGEQAQLTLAGWEESSLVAICADTQTPASVLEYFISPENHRTAVLRALLSNEAVPEERIAEAARSAAVGMARDFLEHPRIRASVPVLRALAENPNLGHAIHQALQQRLEALGVHPNESAFELEDFAAQSGTVPYEVQHAAEIIAEEGKPFQLVMEHPDEEDLLAALAPLAGVEVQGSAANVARLAEVKAPEHKERISVLQKIARMSVGDRVQLAMKGTRDERFILIRDGSKVVSLAVLESPKVTETEVEAYASMKNVQESVLRTIASKRRFLKQYVVIRALVNNPRTPLDVSLPLMNHLLMTDLRHLTMNKNVGEMLRKIALKQYRDKLESRKT